MREMSQSLFSCKSEKNHQFVICFITISAYSADNKLMIFFFSFFSESRFLHLENTLNEMSKLIFWE